MKGTAMAVVVVGTVTVAQYPVCNFPVPQLWMQKGARMDSFSCSLSENCCHGLQDMEQLLIHAKGGPTPDPAFPDASQKDQLMTDLVGTCGRADQVDLYLCAQAIWPKLVPQKAEAGARRMVGDCNVSLTFSTDGSGHCSLDKGKGKGTFEIDGVSTGCCDRASAVIKNKEEASAIFHRSCHGYGHGEACHKAAKAAQALEKEGQCGMIGACGKEDQVSIVKFAKGMMKGKGKGGGPHPGELELLETFNMTFGGAQQMMATFMTSEAEDDVTEDDATEDGSHIVTGLLGFVAGAAVTGLGVTVLRRKTPSSQDEYNEIVA